LQQSGRVRRRALSVAGFRCSTRNTAVELGVGELTRSPSVAVRATDVGALRVTFTASPAPVPPHTSPHDPGNGSGAASGAGIDGATLTTPNAASSPSGRGCERRGLTLRSALQLGLGAPLFSCDSRH